MGNQVIVAGPLSKIWDFFTSVKLTIVLLLSLAVTSIIGTLIPQNEDPQAYFQAFGGVLYRLFSLLDLFDMYHSWWFQLLILMLTANIVICSIDRMSANRRILFVRHSTFNLSRFRNLKRKEILSDHRSPQELKENDLIAVLNQNNEIIALALSKIDFCLFDKLKSNQNIARNLIDKGYYLRRKQ